MNISNPPGLRYYARFRGAYGCIRAVMTHQKSRKYFTIPVAVTAEIAAAMTSDGQLPRTSFDAARADARLHRWGRVAHRVGRDLIAAGTYESTPSAVIAAMIARALDAQDKSAEDYGVTAEDWTPCADEDDARARAAAARAAGMRTVERWTRTAEGVVWDVAAVAHTAPDNDTTIK